MYQLEALRPELLHSLLNPKTEFLLGSSWVVISRVISRVTILITHIRGLITLLITTHEPPSRHHPAPISVPSRDKPRHLTRKLRDPKST